MSRVIFFLMFSFTFLFFTSCGGHDETIKVCDPQGIGPCVTIMDVSTDKRYIYYNLPKEYDTNYIELDISKVDRSTDGVFVRWEDGEVHTSNPDAVLLTNRLIDQRFYYSKSLPSDGNGMPDAIIFHTNGVEVNMFSKSIFPKR